MNFRPSAALLAFALLLSPLCAEPHPGAETAVRSVYPSLVRIYVVSENGSGGRMEKSGGICFFT